MRTFLSAYCGQTISAYATFKEFGKQRRSDFLGDMPPLPTALIKDITLKNGVYLSDHMWVVWDRLPYFSWLLLNTEIEITGKVISYSKVDASGKVYVDYKIDLWTVRKAR